MRDVRATCAINSSRRLIMELQESNNCSAIYTKSLSIRIVSGITCSASILGSILIILSYLCFKKLRTRVREILVHLSVTDAGVATANLVGIAVYFDSYYTIKCDQNGHVYELIPPREYIDNLCRSQAFFAIYFTLSSILWTVSLAIYLYFILVHHGTQKAKYFLVFAYFFCYGMPLMLSLWALLTDRLGYSPYNSAGWCTVILVNPKRPHQRDIFMGVIGYDMWIYVALVLVPVLYLAIKTFLREELRRTKDYVSRTQFWKAVNVLEYKFLSIPIAFFLLRMWTCIINLIYYIDIEGVEVPQFIVYLSGVGDSGQGFINAILFVVLTKQVRNSFLQPFQCRCKSKRRGDENIQSSDSVLPISENQETILSCKINHKPSTSSRSGAITPDTHTS